MKWRGAPLITPWQHRHSRAPSAAAEWITYRFTSPPDGFAHNRLLLVSTHLREDRCLSMITWSPQQHCGHWSPIMPSALIWDQLWLQRHITAAGWTHGGSSGEVFCNNLLQTLWGAKSWCRYRIGFSWHRENFLPDSPLFPPLFVLDVCQRDRASLGNYPPFPLSIMFTFAAFCYMLSLVLCVSLIFFAIWHVSTLKCVFFFFWVSFSCDW